MHDSKETQPAGLLQKSTQILLPGLTILGFLLTSLKMPQYGIVINLVAQIFWIYAGWQAWKKASQIGIFINSVIVTVIILAGVINYWLLK